jgi:FlgD Ig-like domain
MTLVARITFVVLVGASFAAFFVAQRLKGAPPVVRVKGPQHWLSPNGDGIKDRVTFTVRVRHTDDVTIEVVDAGGDRVRRIADGMRAPARVPLRFSWGGTTDAGTRAPDGAYQLRINLRRQARTVTRGSMIVDTRRPRPVVTVLRPGHVIGPVAGPVQVRVRPIPRRFPTRFRVLRTDAGPPPAPGQPPAPPREVATFSSPPKAGQATWDGRVDGAPAPEGIYFIQAVSQDRAGNVGVTPVPTEAGEGRGLPGVTVRSLAVQPPLRPVTAGTRAAFMVDARRRAYRWSVRRIGSGRIVERGRGRAGQTRLAIRAPRADSGAYLLQVRAAHAETRVPFLVQSTERTQVLVVVPALTWLGADRVDDPPFDGVPNTLETGGPVRWPRVLSGDGGLPPGFADSTAPLLVFLDRAGIRYDLTSDLDLALSGNPRASDRTAVLLAGAERWIPPGLGARLRRYVLDGGRLASFGTESLRRGVTLEAAPGGAVGSLLRPTQPTAQDAFGTRLGPVRRTPEPATLTLIGGEADYGLMTGVVGLPGFTRLEESAPVAGTGAKLLAGVGQELTDAEAEAAAAQNRTPRAPRPALAAVRLGKGLLIRVGLPEWPQQLHERDVAQVTRNILDLLRGRTPRPAP